MNTAQIQDAESLGRAACAKHYAEVDCGLRAEHPLPENPFPEPTEPNQRTEWHGWNWGWSGELMCIVANDDAALKEHIFCTGNGAT